MRPGRAMAGAAQAASPVTEYVAWEGVRKSAEHFRMRLNKRCESLQRLMCGPCSLSGTTKQRQTSDTTLTLLARSGKNASGCPSQAPSYRNGLLARDEGLLAAPQVRQLDGCSGYSS
jgi:hypothetical protein